MHIDKINGEIAFNDSTHKYFNVKYPDRKYTSVTTLIGKYHEQFDAQFWSSYKAMERLMPEDFITSGLKADLLKRKKFAIETPEIYGVGQAEFEATKEEILTSYDTVRDIACERGTSIHNQEEEKWYTKPAHELFTQDFGIGLQGNFVCEKHNFDLNREDAILPEYLVYFSTQDALLNMAGQIDLLIKKGNDLYILDYKTNVKGIETKAYYDVRKKKKQMMHFPINDVEDSTLEHYTLQLSLYAYMLQRINPEFNIKLLRIIHINVEGEKTFIDLPYRKVEVEKLLKHYKKELAVDYFRETGKHFDY